MQEMSVSEGKEVKRLSEKEKKSQKAVVMKDLKE